LITIPEKEILMSSEDRLNGGDPSSVAGARLVYSPPKLVVYGDITALTKTQPKGKKTDNPVKDKTG